MAYAAVVTVSERSISGRRHVVVTVAETGAAAGSETVIPGMPTRGTIVGYNATLTAGTGTTIDPEIGRSAAFVVAAQSGIVANGAAAANIKITTAARYYSSAGTLAIRSVPNDAAADHVIATEICILDGWE